VTAGELFGDAVDAEGAGVCGPEAELPNFELIDEIHEEAELRLARVFGASGLDGFSRLLSRSSPGSLDGCDGGVEMIPCGESDGTVVFDDALPDASLPASFGLWELFWRDVECDRGFPLGTGGTGLFLEVASSFGGTAGTLFVW
jgi:hypothetical protein